MSDMTHPQTEHLLPLPSQEESDNGLVRLNEGLKKEFDVSVKPL